MPETRATITVDQKPELLSLLRRLPAILTGREPDVNGIGAGFRARIGYTILSLIVPNFNTLSLGQSGIDGTKWPPLSKEYLAYGRRFGPGEQRELKAAQGLGPSHRLAPGTNRYTGRQNKGLLNDALMKLWRRTYADRLAFFISRMPDDDAKARAAAIAWIVVKAAGGKTKLEVYGNRQVQILVDTGRLRNSLQPGTLMEIGPGAEYQKPGGARGTDQVFDLEPGRVSVGTNVKYAAYHHAAKSPRRLRRLWPEKFPDDWWNQILGAAVSGLGRITETLSIGGTQ